MNGTAPVLVLNKNWSPVRITNALDALSKMFEGRARAVSEDYGTYDFDSWAELALKKEDPYVVTVRWNLKVPNVILLSKYDEVPSKKLTFSRANIYRRDKYMCQYCGEKPGTEELTIDHVIPKSRQGKTSWTNCVVACLPCNRKKANHLAHEVGLKLRSTPVKPNWNPMLVLHRVKNTPANWKKFVSDAYWNQALSSE
jgi:5-methylcytosine-specific restriction endonuclease McrA